jgi:hypothetical protein
MVKDKIFDFNQVKKLLYSEMELCSTFQGWNTFLNLKNYLNYIMLFNTMHYHHNDLLEGRRECFLKMMSLGYRLLPILGLNGTTSSVHQCTRFLFSILEPYAKKLTI